MTPRYVYVASSWANPVQQIVCEHLRTAGIDHYDFRNPAENVSGFHWSEVMPSYPPNRQRQPGQAEALAQVDEYLMALGHPAADEGFERDWEAMQRADWFVMVLPCGRSAHLELGWAVGHGRNTVILLDADINDGMVVPELMYKMVDHISPHLDDLRDYLEMRS